MDQREAVRVPVRVRARCRCHGVVIDGFVEDLSRSGLFLRAPEMIASGSSAAIDLEHSGEREGMGLRFVDPGASGVGLANLMLRQHATAWR
jgi:PilZ domain